MSLAEGESFKHARATAQHANTTGKHTEDREGERGGTKTNVLPLRQLRIEGVCVLGVYSTVRQLALFPTHPEPRTARP